MKSCKITDSEGRSLQLTYQWRDRTKRIQAEFNCATASDDFRYGLGSFRVHATPTQLRRLGDACHALADEVTESNQ